MGHDQVPQRLQPRWRLLHGSPTQRAYPDENQGGCLGWRPVDASWPQDVAQERHLFQGLLLLLWD